MTKTTKIHFPGVRPFARPLLAMLLLLLVHASATAQPKITLPTAKAGEVEQIVPVMAHSARCACVSDVHGLLAFGHGRTYADAQVSVLRLDAKGTPLAYAQPLKLPRPEALAKAPQYVTGIAFHPKLPLLYVWQDIYLNYTNPPTKQVPELDQFDHLHVFNVAKETPELVVSLCRGTEYIYGQQGGTLAVDSTGSYLYVPNVRELKNAGSLRLGRFPLDADGLPAPSETDAKESVAVRAKKLMEANAIKPWSPPKMTPPEYVHMFHLSSFGSGHSLHAVGKDAVLTGAFQGIISWRPDDKFTALNALPLKNTGHTQIALHPKLPAIYATAYSSTHPDSFFRAEQSEGYLSLLPRQYVIPESKLSGPTAVLGKSNQLAIGGQFYVYLVNLDDKGFPTGVPMQTQVNAPAVRALAYSERFDRLYVGVEVSK